MANEESLKSRRGGGGGGGGGSQAYRPNVRAAVNAEPLIPRVASRGRQFRVVPPLVSDGSSSCAGSLSHARRRHMIGTRQRWSCMTWSWSCWSRRVRPSTRPSVTNVSVRTPRQTRRMVTSDPVGRRILREVRTLHVILMEHSPFAGRIAALAAAVGWSDVRSRRF